MIDILWSFQLNLKKKKSNATTTTYLQHFYKILM